MSGTDEVSKRSSNKHKKRNARMNPTVPPSCYIFRRHRHETISQLVLYTYYYHHYHFTYSSRANLPALVASYSIQGIVACVWRSGEGKAWDEGVVDMTPIPLYRRPRVRASCLASAWFYTHSCIMHSKYSHVILVRP